jgi:hypothetical protein
MRGKAIAATMAAGALATGIVVWTMPNDSVQLQNLTDNGVRGLMVKVFGRTFVFYTAKNRPKKR